MRGESYLVVDPLGHCQSASGYFRPNLIFGRALLSIQLAMWNLGSRSSPVPQGVDKVTFYVMTKNALLGPGNYWTSLPQWPDYKPEPLYLADDNKLAFTAGEANNMTYSFDPKNPVPTRGGANLFEACGPLDQVRFNSETATNAPHTLHSISPYFLNIFDDRVPSYHVHSQHNYASSCFSFFALLSLRRLLTAALTCSCSPPPS